MERQQHIITDLKKLIFLFNAGAGEFFFLNMETQKQFCLRFKPTVKENVSTVYVCFVTGKEVPFYRSLAQYNFKEQRLYMRTEPNMGSNSLKFVINSLDFIFARINTGKSFPDSMLVYYSGHCCRCGQKLTNPASLEQGLGDECLEQYKKTVPKMQLNLF